MAKTREEWLEKAVKLLDKEFFSGRGYKLPEKMKVACGFAKGGGDVIGQCWCPTVTEDNVTHMFICPTQGEATRVLDILLHEMIHACLGVKAKHGPQFKKLATEFGLTGKMRATVVAEGSELQKKLITMSGVLGDYPHSAIVLKKKIKGGGDGDGEKSERKWLTFVSKSEAKYNVGIHLTKVLEFGRPRDFNGEPMVAKKEEVESMLQESGV
jgi:hypothetical protein